MRKSIIFQLLATLFIIVAAALILGHGHTACDQCHAQCQQAYDNCISGCGGDPQCEQQCGQQKGACHNECWLGPCQT